MPPVSTDPSPHKLLIAHRGEIAVRIAAAAATLEIPTVSIYSEDDAACLHVKHTDESVALPGAGPRAYLDAERILDIARERSCTAVHPGYGFLAEDAAFAARAAECGVVFVGPRPETLATLGDKAAARRLAREHEVPVLAGTDGPTTLEAMQAFFAEQGRAACVIKAVAGGGGRGIRMVRSGAELPEAFERCASEARAAFGSDALYIERHAGAARHVEVQIVGDRSGQVRHLGERDCSVQRRHQKLIEVAPAPGLPARVREALLSDAVRLARAVGYEGLGTFEFLVDPKGAGYWFIEANPRLQVEHPVTEAVLGVDLVQIQLRLALGARLEDVGLDPSLDLQPRGYAIEARVNMETLTEHGEARPASGTLTEFEVPSGPGIRVDTFGYRGYTPSTRFDPLLAKVVVHSTSEHLPDAARASVRALSQFRIAGLATNLDVLARILSTQAFAAGRVTTRFVEENAAVLAEGPEPVRRTFETVAPAGRSLAGATLHTTDPLAVLTYGKARPEGAEPRATHVGEGLIAVRAPLQGSIVSVDVRDGQLVSAAAPLLVMEAMKMEHVVEAPRAGVVREIRCRAGDTVYEQAVLVVLEPASAEAAHAAGGDTVDLDSIRPDLGEVRTHHGYGLDENRPDAVTKRHAAGRRTARENVADLVDPGTFVEYGPLVIAAQRGRREVQELMERTPADGLITGVGRINGDRFAPERCQSVVVAYDYTVLAGTQGTMNHRKKDRMFQVAAESRLPVVVFAEGGGGRPGDTDYPVVGGLDCMAWTLFGKLSGLVPLVGITTGFCFAGNAVLLGQCDVVIATHGSNIGLGGPAMIEGGGLGVFRPEEVGPLEVQRQNGVVDIVVADEAEAVRAARQYLGFFQGALEAHTSADPRLLRSIVPENRLRVYDVHRVLETLADTGSVLELRRDFAPAMVTALARVEGKTLGIIANNPAHLAGAIDSAGADKAARFMQLCDAFDVPLLFLCDTPGIMVGPEAEKTATARHATRLFNTAANLTIPFFTIVLRKAYGLGAMAMAGGSFKAPRFVVGWPTAEFGGMGLEGAVKLGARKALEALETPEERQKLFESLVAMMYDRGRSVNAAPYFEFDDVIDPADSRLWIRSVLAAAPEPWRRTDKKRPFVDTW
jgi:acetyl/propionyl-CoA carboxylase alpha subunit/acetyl-CoA carboxylase carboxyltransferase component